MTKLPAITKTYPKVAFSSAITPATEEHYEHLKQAGIETVSVCLHLSGYNHSKYATLHTNLARKAEMITHAFFVTDLYNPVDDVMKFFQRFNLLGYHPSSKITIWINSDKNVRDREKEISKMLNLMERFHKREYIDLCFFKRDLDARLYNLEKIPKHINLTVVNCQSLTSEVAEAGTWVYTTDFCDTAQSLAYDYYGFYTDNTGYQLSLVDTDYVVQPGDTWLSIARRHGMAIDDLLEMNRAVAEEKIYSGQVVRIA